jgi:hypothetical protein
MPLTVERNLLFSLLFLLQAGYSSPVFALDVKPPVFGLNFNANWDYRETGGEDVDTLRIFQQRYSLGGGAGQRLSYQPTSALTATAGVGYTRSQHDSGQGIVDLQQLTPSTQLSVTNDIFLAQLSGVASSSRIEPPSGTVLENSSKSWDASLATAWQIPLVPSLRVNTSEMTNTNAGIFSAVNQAVSTSSKSNTMALDWDLILAKFNYIYTDQTNTDPLENFTDSKSHFARFETGGSFWDKRLGMRFAQQFQKTTQGFDLRVDQGGLALLPLGGQASAFVYDPSDPAAGIDPFTLPEPLDVPLAPIGTLSDGDLDVPALSVVANGRVALGFEVDLAQQIDLLRLTISTLLTNDQAAALQWSLYVNPDDNGWVKVAEVITVNYDSIAKRFTMTIDRDEAKIMVVAVNNTGNLLEFTEIEAFSQHTENFGSSKTGNLTNFGMGLKLTETLRASAGLTLDNIESESGDITRTVDRMSTNANLRWTPIPSVAPSLGFSETRIVESGKADARTNSYSLTLATIPLPSMNVTFGASLRESYRDERKTRSGSRYNLTTTARIYPDLNASMHLSASESEEYDDGARIIGNSSAFSGNFNLVAALRRYVTANLASSYSKTRRNAESPREAANALLSLQYRPSPLLALRGSYATRLLGEGGADSFDLGLNLALLRTRKARLNLLASHTQAETVRDNISLNGGWDISKNLLLLANGNLIFAEKYSYALQASLKLRF